MNNLPILVFKGCDDACYGIMKTYSESFRDALLSIGEEVVFTDANYESLQSIIGKEFKAIVAFMDIVFNNNIPGTPEPLFNKVYGPKFNYWPDHPAIYYPHINNIPNDYHVLTHDRNYVRFVNRYYPGINAFFLPPGGNAHDKSELRPFEEREYGVSFIGTYGDWHDVLNTIDRSSEITMLITSEYIDTLVQDPDLTTEDALTYALKKLDLNVSEKDWLSILIPVHRISCGIAHLYREKVVKTILDAKIDLNVFGNSWRQSPFCNNPHLIIHEESSADHSFRLYNNSKISLNVMSWHKDSITERILDSMMAGSIVLSDETPALRDYFVPEDRCREESEILLYSLKHLEKIPDIIIRNMDDHRIAERGYNKALNSHSWNDVANRFIEILSETGYV